MLYSSSAETSFQLHSGYISRGQKTDFQRFRAPLQAALSPPPDKNYGHLLHDYTGWDGLLVQEPRLASYQPRYMDLRKDFAFKHIFGKESNKDLLIDFLNSLFQERKTINDLRYGPMERQGETEDIRKVAFDIQCASDQGEQFLIEMQREQEDSFFRRLLYYALRLGVEQVPAGKKGDKYPLPKICAIAILNYDPWKDIGVPPGQENEYINFYQLENIKNYHRYPVAFELTLVELPRFTKSITELHTNLDNWLYLMKTSAHLQEQPSCFEGPVFEKLFRLTEYQKINKEDRNMIIDKERDQRNRANVHRREGRLEGEAIGEKRGEKRMEALKDLSFVQNLINSTSFDDQEIATLAGVTESFVRQQR